MKKLVDGCISAISNDVKVNLKLLNYNHRYIMFLKIEQKVVSQKLIDESKHIKLEAERDIPFSNKKGAKRPQFNRNQANKNNLGFGSSAQGRSASVNEVNKNE